MTNTIVFRYDPKQSKVVSAKIDYSEVEKLAPLAQVAKLHIPIVEAMKKESSSTFERVELDLPSLPVVLKVVDIPEREQ